MSDSITGTLYTNIQENGVACKLTTTSPSQTYYYTDLILYQVDGVDYVYFTRGNSPKLAILGNNSDIHLSVTIYSISNGSVRDTGTTEYIESSTPSDYYTNIKTGNFTLVQRS